MYQSEGLGQGGKLLGPSARGQGEDRDPQPPPGPPVAPSEALPPASGTRGSRRVSFFSLVLILNGRAWF